jgi:hypothetical protein
MSKLPQRYEPSKILWEFDPVKILKQLFLEGKSFKNEKVVLGDNLKGKIVMKKQNDYLHWFWLNVAVCHDVMVTTNPKKPDQLIF